MLAPYCQSEGTGPCLTPILPILQKKVGILNGLRQKKKEEIRLDFLPCKELYVRNCHLVSDCQTCPPF